MFNLKTLTETVQQNCHISDAQYAGQYTLCIFLLKMREYYRWEKDIPQSHALPREAVGDWLTAREEFWDSVETLPFAPLTIGNEEFAPFDAQAINEQLKPHGLGPHQQHDRAPHRGRVSRVVFRGAGEKV